MIPLISSEHFFLLDLEDKVKLSTNTFQLFQEHLDIDLSIQCIGLPTWTTQLFFF